MKNRVNSLWTLFQERRLSRRTFYEILRGVDCYSRVATYYA